MANNITQFPGLKKSTSGKKSTLRIFWERSDAPETVLSTDMEESSLFVQVMDKIEQLEVNWDQVSEQQKSMWLPEYKNPMVRDNFIDSEGNLIYLEPSVHKAAIVKVMADLTLAAIKADMPDLVKWIDNLTVKPNRVITDIGPQYSVKLQDLTPDEIAIFSIFGNVFKILPVLKDAEFLLISDAYAIGVKLNQHAEVYKLA